MRKGWRPSEVIFKTGLKAFLLMVVAGLKSGKNCSVTLSVRISPDKPAEHLSGSPICHAILVTEDESTRLIGASPSSYMWCARSISMSRPFSEGIHLERLTLRKPVALESSAPSGNPTSCMLFLLLLSSYPSSSRWVAPADFFSPWLSSYPHAQLLERNQPGHVSASQR